MSDPMNPDPSVERLETSLTLLDNAVRERSEAESRADRERAQREEAANKAYQEARQQNSTWFEQEKRKLQDYADREPAGALEEFERIRDDADRVLRKKRAEADRILRDELERTKQELADERWEIGTVCEAAINEAQERLDQVRNRLNDTYRSLRQIQDEKQQFLKQRRMVGLDKAIPAEEPNSDTETASPSIRIVESALDEAVELNQRLAKLLLPRFVRGIRPAILILIPLAIGALVGGLQWDWRQGAGIGAAAGGVTGLLLALLVILLSRHQVSTMLKRLHQQIHLVEHEAKRTQVSEASLFHRREQHLLQGRNRDQGNADARAKQRASIAKEGHAEIVGKATSDHQQVLAEAESKRDQIIHRVAAEVARREPEIKATFDAQRERNRTAFDHALQQSRAQQSQDIAHYTSRWRSQYSEVMDTFETVSGALEPWFPDWKTMVDNGREPIREVPDALRLGTLRVDLEMFPEGNPRDPALMSGLRTEFQVPAIIDCPDACSVLFYSDSSSRESALSALQATMLRILTGFPPGKARFVMIDPVGLGETFAAFMHLGDYDEQLVSSRVWTESQHIEQRLQDLTEHMELVIQKYLRNQYASITEYNEVAGEVAEPFRFLVVADFPIRFNEAAARRLLSIAQSGPRCGVHVLMTIDTRQELPQGLDLRDLERHCAVVRWRGEQPRWSNPVQGRFPLTLDKAPEAALFSEIVHQAGRRAEGASRVEVPFSFLAPPKSEYWSEDSGRGVSIPIGKAGATTAMRLKLGSGTAQHVLIAGKTGSGKSTLLHALITSAALQYAPNQLEFYLIDFKKGVEFKAYATHRLPHARVIAIESEREFGLSVLRRIDEELKERGDRFRAVGAQDLGGFRTIEPGKPMPRMLLIVDEFHEFFVEDDKIAQESALLLDRLVRQGRAFGIHVLLGSQTLAGAYTLARATIGQMAVRIALQCSESDASLILSDENTAARLLSRPGEAIYNDANGRIEGNSLFQVVWLPDAVRESYLQVITDLAEVNQLDLPAPLVFEGSVNPLPSSNEPLRKLIEATEEPAPKAKVSSAWLGVPVAIKPPTAMVFRRQTGSHLMIIGQNSEAALGLISCALVSLAAQRSDARFLVLDGTAADDPLAGLLERVLHCCPNPSESVTWSGVESAVADLAAEVERRRDEGTVDPVPIYLFIQDLQRFRQLRKSEDDFGFSSSDPDEPVKPSEHLATIIRDGPPFAVHIITWSDTLNTLNRTFERSVLRELETRVLFQMSAADSSTLIDSPVANRLGNHRALFVNEDAGLFERFQPYGPPSQAWLDQVAALLSDRSNDVPKPEHSMGEDL